jgi:hypothetical protein
VHGSGLENVVENDLERPRFREVHGTLADNREDSYRQTPGVQPHKFSDGKLASIGMSNHLLALRPTT